jgi:8-oxo-dGTP diphosphatase
MARRSHDHVRAGGRATAHGSTERIAVELRTSAVVIREDRILLMLHTRDRRSYWVLPGGHPLGNEIASAAVEREVLEETGLRVRAGRVLFVWEGIAPAGGRRLVEIVFDAELRDRLTEPVSRSSAEIPRFLPIEGLATVQLYPPVGGDLRGAWRRCFSDTAPYLGNVWRSMRAGSDTASEDAAS